MIARRFSDCCRFEPGSVHRALCCARRLAVGVLLLSMAGRAAQGDEKLAGIACRSVHLAFPAPVGAAFYNEVIIDQSAEGTYFMVCGWDKGYFGLQELSDGRKVILFSVWDPGSQNDPDTVRADQRVKLLYRDPQVRVGRFGNEGTGGQSFFDYDWQVGATYRCLVLARADGDRTEYSGYFFPPEQQVWRRLVTFSTPTGGTLLKGCYSFVEDFRRNRISATKTRQARFGPGWVRAAAGDWRLLAQARFTADANPVLNIDAGQRDGRFFLATGGDLENRTTRLRELIPLASPASLAAPLDVVQLAAEQLDSAAPPRKSPGG